MSYVIHCRGKSLTGYISNDLCHKSLSHYHPMDGHIFIQKPIVHPMPCLCVNVSPQTLVVFVNGVCFGGNLGLHFLHLFLKVS